jgi:hypothetical protein
MSWLSDLFGKKRPTPEEMAQQLVNFEQRLVALDEERLVAKERLDEAEKKALMGAGGPSKQLKELREQVFEATSMAEACRGVIDDLRVELLQALHAQKQAHIEELTTQMAQAEGEADIKRKTFFTAVAAAIVAQIAFDGGESQSRSSYLPRHRQEYLSKPEREFISNEIDRLKAEAGITVDHTSAYDRFHELDREHGNIKRWDPTEEDVERLINAARTEQAA